MNENYNILIVDDNSVNRTYFSMSLKKSGFNVSSAENGCQAIDICRTKKFDLILMDIRMPDLDGFKVSKELKLNSINTDTPIIATSAEKSSDDDYSIFSDFLLKPISPNDLKAKVLLYCNECDHLTFNKNKALGFAYQDTEIMKKLIAMFSDDLEIQYKLLKSTTESCDFGATKEIIHKLRGSCKTCGASELDQILSQFNQTVQSNTVDSNKEYLFDISQSIEKYLKLVDKVID